MFACCVALGTFVALALLPAVATQVCTSTGTPGLPGIPGFPGRDGRDGATGEKGEPGRPFQTGQVAEKGEKGERGPMGPTGKIGRTGAKGQPGLPGPVGPPGDMGLSGVYSLAQQSAFSVSRRTRTHPVRNTPVRFSNIITNVNNHFDMDSGKFICHIPGTYYFVYHTSSESSLCVVLKRDGESVASFCDHLYNTVQVSSGGLALYLRKDQKVWLETTDYNGMIGVEGRQSVFSGFLLYPH
ncbi:complement C1q subcomponent subunit C [Megalops cyprinoides]|uniref:complement C1q subcomponent subunit C n=1 Tax=Megalops cyprinoides TaxID=118141 RepID=UPI0018651C1D|nr:complement C1q subcomponent subunit C [Megalops cyprinoides]